ncbi:hypothetical protein PHISCL_08449 [Aspergillus sclerotialis]|uniref:Uncharacterized protein n=1 Tax=Aspergillus sclerotialis TaxID=2070753 RepID=A0A3A2Z7Z0_9EURO|nr:hypothetical protein PHISCL_08449 [Aspergillus sclerotialis]
MDVDEQQLCGPGVSYMAQTRIPLSDISEMVEVPSSESTFEDSTSSFASYSTALTALNASNEDLEVKMAKLRTSTLQLKRDIVRFQQHIRAFHHELLPTWQADILTRLIEIVYTAQRRKLPGGFTPGERQGVDRWALTRAYTVAARKIYQSTLWMAFGLPMQYHLALHKYEEIVEFRSSNPYRSECPFAQWLVSEKENNPSLYAFWAKLFPICYDRTVEESAEIIPMLKTVGV